MRKLFALALFCSPCWGAWTYSASVQVDRTKCGASTMSNFPVEISITSNTLKTVANGGSVTSSSGYDIVVATTSAIGTYVPWEVESWDGTAGTWVGWALLPTVNGSSAGSNTTFGFAVGNSAITTQQNVGGFASTAVWDSNYKMVLHLGNGGTLNLNDSTSNGNNGTNSGATAQSGQIDGAAGFSGSTWISMGHTGFPTGAAVFTMSCWLIGTTPGGYHTAIAVGDNAVLNHGAGIGAFNGAPVAGGAGTAFGGGGSVSAWHYMVLAYTGTQQRIWQDGVEVTGSPSTQTYNLSTTFYRIGDDGYGESLQGVVDEARISTGIVRSSDWILAEYHNGNAPGNIGTPGFLIFTTAVPPVGSFAIIY